MFKVGQDVVFVTDKGCFHTVLKVNEVYKIRHIAEDGWIAVDGDLVFEYQPAHFRPLDDGFADRVLSEICELIEQEQLIET